MPVTQFRTVTVIVRPANRNRVSFSRRVLRGKIATDGSQRPANGANRSPLRSVMGFEDTLETNQTREG
jgi:hypothetical protein